jgi:hypothetical protein
MRFSNGGTHDDFVRYIRRTFQEEVINRSPALPAGSCGVAIGERRDPSPTTTRARGLGGKVIRERQRRFPIALPLPRTYEARY